MSRTVWVIVIIIAAIALLYAKQAEDERQTRLHNPPKKYIPCLYDPRTGEPVHVPCG